MNILTTVFPADKLNHYMRGTWAGALGACIAALAGWPLWVAAATAALSALLVGGIKEGVDDYQNELAASAGEPLPHEVSLADALWTAAGGLPIAVALAVAWLA